MATQKIRIRLKGYDHEVVDQSAKLIVETAQKTGARVSGPVPLPTERNLYTVIRSPHVKLYAGKVGNRKGDFLKREIWLTEMW